jgi:hypothetical protein
MEATFGAGVHQVHRVLQQLPLLPRGQGGCGGGATTTAATIGRSFSHRRLDVRATDRWHPGGAGVRVGLGSKGGVRSDVNGISSGSDG